MIRLKNEFHEFECVNGVLTSGVCSINNFSVKDFLKAGGFQNFGPKNVDAKLSKIRDQPNK